MNSFSESATGILLPIVIGLAVFVFVLAVALALNIWLSAKARRRWKSLLTGVQSENLENLLYEHLRQLTALEGDIERLGGRVESIESKMPHTKRYAGLVRFDAFDEVGGEQSFALAVYDELGNGFVMSSLYGRTESRTYCKQLVGGKSDRLLSTEEEQAIQVAATQRTRPKINH